MATYTLDTIEEGLRFLESGPDDIEFGDVTFGGELAGFTAIVDGKNYHGTVPGGLARGLWELQEELYRAVAFALYGEDSYRRLTEEQKAQFELIFEVREGSTDLFAPLKDFLTKLGEGFQNMESGHKMKTLIAIVLILAGAYGATKVCESISESKQKLATLEADAKEKEGTRQLAIAQEAAKTEQFRLIADIVRKDETASRFAKATEEGTKAIIKGASDATRIKIGRASFNRSDIIEVNQRAAKESAQARIVTDVYKIIRADARDGGVTRFLIADSAGAEFSAIVVDEEFDAKQLNRLWEAVRNRTKIKLEVNVASVRNQVKSAGILRVVD
jgi:hypothetical protein